MNEIKMVEKQAHREALVGMIGAQSIKLDSARTRLQRAMSELGTARAHYGACLDELVTHSHALLKLLPLPEATVVTQLRTKLDALDREVVAFAGEAQLELPAVIEAAAAAPVEADAVEGSVQS